MRTTVTTVGILGIALTLTSFSTYANPVGGTVVGGNRNGTISGQGTAATTIHQSGNKVIINWQDFSIGAGEVTRFIQPSATATALNRVMSGNPSQIYGSLQANGRVFVINPNGILVGAGGQIDTKAFVASTLNVRDSDFMSRANLIFSGDSTAGVRNEGAIQALGGDVFLIAHHVENAGTIQAPGGTVGLAAGSRVQLMQSGNERISVLAGNPSAPAAAGVNNSGTIEATSAELKAAGGNIYALAINNGGIVRADGLVRRNGHIYLGVTGGNIENSGTLSAKNADGSGGAVVVNGGHNATDPATVINSGTIEARGDAAGTQGGQVRLLGDRVGLYGNAVVDVSGDAGGGTALIGGDYQGKNPDIQNADATFLGSHSRISADALTHGDGGKVIVWSDNLTRVYGSISASGKGAGASGGFIETSSKNVLDLIGAYVNPGAGGTWLLDPRDVTINNAATAGGTFDGGTPDNTFTPSANSAVVDRATIQTSLDADVNVVITTGSLANGAQDGDITVAASITKAAGSGATLSLIAGDDITISAAITGSATHPLNVVLQGGVATGDGAPGNININDAITTFGGSFTTIGRDFAQGGGGTPGTISTAGGAISLRQTGALAISEIINSGGGNVKIEADALDIAAAINAVAGRVTIQTVTASRVITLGGAPGGTLSLLDAELDNVTAGTLQIGNNVGANGAISGQIDIAGDLTPSGTTILSLQTGAAIVESAGNSITISDLALRAGGAITMNQGNHVANLAASGNGVLQYIDATGVTIGAVDGVNGVSAGNNAVTIETLAGDLVVNNTGAGNDVDAGSSTVSLTAGGDNSLLNIAASAVVRGNGGATLRADRITLAGNLNATTSATLRQDSAGREITLGTDDVDDLTAATGTLGLTDAELDRVTTSILQIGSAASGNISVTAAISPSSASTLSLLTGGTISQTAGITVANLVAKTLNNVGSSIILANAANDVNSIDLRVRNAADSGDAPAAISYRDATGFTVSTVTGGAGITLVADAGSILDDGTPAQVASSGAASVTAVTATAGSIGTAANPLDIGSSGATANVNLTAAAGAVHENVTTSGSVQFTASTDNGANITTTFAQGTRTYTATYLDGAGGDFTLNANGNILNTAGITVLDTLGIFSLRSTLANGTLGTGPAPIIASAATVRLNTTGATGNANVVGTAGLNLGASSIGGNLTASAATGDVTDSGAVTVGGNGSFTATTVNGNITLDSGLNVSGTIALQTSGTGDATIANGSDIDFATSSIGRNLVASAASGNITDSGTLTVGGNSTFTAATGASILLDSPANSFAGTLSFLASGIGNLDDVTVVDASDTDLQALTIDGDLTVTSGGNITQSGTLNIAGDASFTTRNDTAKNITLALTVAGLSVNNFGSFAARTLNAAGAAAVAGTIFVREQGDLDIRAINTSGNAILVSGGNMTDSGTLTVGGNALFETLNAAPKNITLDDAGSTFGTIQAATFDTVGTTVAGNISIRESGDMDLRDVITTGNATFTATGNITDNPSAGTRSIGGDATFVTQNDTAKNITLDESGWLFGTLTARTLNSAAAAAVAGAIAISEADSTDLRQVQTTGNATFTSLGAITDSGTLTIGGDASFITRNNSPMNITLDDGSSTFGSVSASTLDAGGLATVGGTISIFESGDMDLRLAQTLAGATFTSSGNITDSGTLTIGGDAVFITQNNAGRNITLNDPASTFGSVTARTLNGAGSTTVGGTISVSEVGAMDLKQVDTTAGATFIATGDITDSGPLTIGGAASFTTAGGQSITLDTPANNFGGTVSFISSGGGNLNNVTVVDATAFDIGGLTLNGILSVTAGGAVSQSGNIIASAFRVSAGASTTLNGNNDVNTLAASVTGAGNTFSFTDVDDLGVGTVSGLSGVSTVNGAVALTADTLQVAQTIDSGTARTTLQPLTAGRNIDLGSETAGTLALTDAELSLITAGVLQIGNATAGAIDVSAAISPAGVGQLSLVNNGPVGGPGSISVGGLRISTVGPVSLAGNNDVNTLAVGSSGVGNAITFRDLNDLTVGTVDGVNGVVANNGAVTLVAANGSLTVNNTAAPFDVDAGTSSLVLTADGNNNLLTIANGAAVRGATKVTLTADQMNILGTVTAVNSGNASILNLIVQPATSGRNVSVGAEIAGQLSLTQNELNQFTANQMLVGGTDVPAITGANTISTPPNVVQLVLVDSGTTTLAASSQLIGLLAGAILPVPKLDVANFSSTSISSDKAAELTPPGSITEFFLQLRFPPTEERKYKVEDISKWTSVGIAVAGQTTGPQQ